ncbi:MAG: urea carboxylase-associated family protein [Dehalococcoidia bacterium]
MAALRDIGMMQASAKLDGTFYERVRAARPRYKLVDRLVVPPFEGRGFRVNRGQTFRIIEEEGTQVADVSFWNAHNPRESFSLKRTWVLEGWFVKIYTRLWSDVPWLRPMATCIEETVDSRLPESDFHHCWMAGSCATEWTELRTGISGMNSCHVNFLQAIEPLGLKEENIRDVLGLFQKMRLDPKTGMFHGARSDSKRGDYIEFYAEMDLLAAVTFCPNGDNTRYYSLPGKDEVFPLGVEIYDTGIQPKEFPMWTDWRPTWKGKWTPPES